MPIEVVSQLRDRNQLTFPDRLMRALEAEPGDDLLMTYDEAEPNVVQVRLLPRSYAGIAPEIFGRSSEERAAYIAEERASWDRDAPGRASDGTPYLTFEESRRTYRQTDVTRERYDREPKLRWPKCEICGRSIAQMKEHQQKHKLGLMTESGVSTDPEQIKRSRRRVRKWRDSLGTQSARRRE
jgi:hypothetical protein